MHIDNGPVRGFGTEFIVISPSNVAVDAPNKVWTPIRKDKIKGVSPVFMDNAPKYPHTNLCKITLEGTTTNFDIQDITNQSWAGTVIGLKTAVEEIESWLN